MFKFSNKVNNILNLFHKEIYEINSARLKMATRKVRLKDTIEVMGLKKVNVNIGKIKREDW